MRMCERFPQTGATQASPLHPTPLPPLRDATGVHLSISGHLTDPHRSAPTRMMRSVGINSEKPGNLSRL